MFTPEKLEELRTQNRARSIETIKRVRAEANATESSGAPDGPGDTAREPGGSEQRVKAIKLEDELKLLKYYQTRIQHICRGMSFPVKVQATAISFLKRFYLSFSSLDHDPKNIMLTVIYLAGKAEESYISAEEFCRVVKQDQQAVLRNELAVLQGLKFDLVVYNPYRPLEGFFQDLEEWRTDPEGGCPDAQLQKAEAAHITKAKQAAKAAVDALMLTDAPLLFSPGQIALAALRSGFRAAELSSASYLARVAKQAPQAGGAADAGGPEARLEQLKAALASIDVFGAAGAKPVNDDEVRKIDRRLKACHNPLLDPESAAYKRAQQQQDKEQRHNRELKVQARHAATQAAEAQLLGMSAHVTQANGQHALPTISEGQPAALAEPAADLGSMDVPEGQPAKRRKSEDQKGLLH
ncbi:hypothetical protein WJX72_001822 [[Myrmecia] bisecta]|uniref:Cyclin-like domain-containing protein n=1 Tax=[Myrmecia] bisecta TaxID=41462 RepID=A0AAW1PJA3_9CHLO